MRPEQGHINQVVGFGNTTGQVGGSGPRIKRGGGVVAYCNTPVAGKTTFDHEVYILEIGIGIASGFVVTRIADISFGVVNCNRRARHSRDVYKLLEERVN